MWTEIKREDKLSLAKRWQELFESEGIPTRILPPKGTESGNYQVLVPKDKEHIIREVLKKL